MARRTLETRINKRRPFEAPEAEAYLNLVRTAQALQIQFERLFKAHGLSASSYNVLRILRGHEDAARERREAFEGVTCSAIASEMVVQVPDLTRLLDRLADAELVVRHRSEADRRVVRVRTTASGRMRLAALDPLVADLHRSQLGHLPRAGLKRLSDLLVQARLPHES